MNRLIALHVALSRHDRWIADWGGSLLLLAVRCHVGWQFFKSGLIKVDDWGATLALFQNEYHVPLLPPGLAAVMGAGGELFLPMLLFIGLLTRPAAFGLFFVNLMAVLSYPQLFGFECPAALQDHFHWGGMLLVLVAFGPGRIAADDWLVRRRTPAAGLR